MSKLINNTTAEEMNEILLTAHKLVEAIRLNSKSDSYVASELFIVLKQCLFAEPRLKFLIEDEIAEYEKLTNK